MDACIENGERRILIIINGTVRFGLNSLKNIDDYDKIMLRNISTRVEIRLLCF